MKTESSYILESDGGKIAAALCKLCQPGEIGEPLVRSGLVQESFNLFTARLAAKHINAGRSPEQLADVFALVSASNASAARQALGGCSITLDGGKKQSVADYWNKSGGAVAKPNLSLLDL